MAPNPYQEIPADPGEGVENDDAITESYLSRLTHQTIGLTNKAVTSTVANTIDFTNSHLASLGPGRLLTTILEDDTAAEKVEHFKYKQDFERKLTVTSVIGLGFTVMGVPFGISSTLWISLIDGGNVTMLYGWLIVAFFSICVVLSLSEIISKYPTAGGVYHFSAILANEKYSSISSWITGWFLLIGNWTYAVSIMFAGSQFILSILGLRDITYKEDVFWVLGTYFIILTFSGLVNFWFSKYLERINKLCILWTIYTVLAIDFLLIFFAKKTNSAKEILTHFDNSRSGWPDPIAFIIGFQSGSFTLTGYGMIFSISDEVKKPEKNLPKGAISAILMATVVGIIFIIPILTILPDMKVLLDGNPEIMPIQLVFKIATESYIISFLLAILLVGTVLFQSIGSLTTASRTTYALARDGALPFKEKWIEVNAENEYKIPKNALFLSMGMVGLISLLSLVSSSAFNAFMGASVISLAFANGIPIFCSMLNKRQKIKGGVFRLRYFGWIVNGIAVGWIILSFLVLSLPPVIKNITWISMNWAIAVFTIFAGFALIGYRAWGVKSFTGPQIDEEYVELDTFNDTMEEMVPSSSTSVFKADDDDDENELHETENKHRDGQNDYNQIIDKHTDTDDDTLSDAINTKSDVLANHAPQTGSETSSQVLFQTN